MRLSGHVGFRSLRPYVFDKFNLIISSSDLVGFRSLRLMYDAK